MSGAAHTPGPWEFDGVCQIFEAKRTYMRVAFLPSDHAEYASSKANGRLIAAAPELVSALEDAEAVMSIVEPRSDKSEYIRVLGVIRSALIRAHSRPLPGIPTETAETVPDGARDV